MRPLHCLIFAAVAPWVATAVLWLYVQSPPVENWHDDIVSPTTVRVGDEIVVSRSFDAMRTDVINVTREMIRGDCKKTCDRIELPGGSLQIEPGEYRGVKKTYIVPAAASPGEWRLAFTIHWEDRFGRSLKQKLPELNIRVVK